MGNVRQIYINQQNGPVNERLNEYLEMTGQSFSDAVWSAVDLWLAHQGESPEVAVIRSLLDQQTAEILAAIGNGTIQPQMPDLPRETTVNDQVKDFFSDLGGW